MPATEILVAFCVATAIFAYMPGPAMLYTTAQTIARGRMAGLMAALGIHLGGYVHVIAAAFGLSALFHAVPVLYVAIKLAGAAYLIWLGLGIVWRAGGEEDEMPEVKRKSAKRAFLESVAVEVLNPKTAVFFLAFLPQFVDAGAAFPLWVQFLVLGTIVNLMFSSADLFCVGLAGAVIERLRRSGTMKRVVQRLGGAILVGLGVHVAFQRALARVAE